VNIIRFPPQDSCQRNKSAFNRSAVAGYGHIAPKTKWGQTVTILYAIFGIPLTLFTITNLGSIMATAFRFIYKYICCGLCCVCCSRRKRWRVARRLVRSTTTGGMESPAVLSRGRRWMRGRSATRSPRDAGESSDDEHQLTWRERVAAVFAGPVNITEVRQISRRLSPSSSPHPFLHPSL